jgi:AMMECR1 domain-containing protein
VVVFSLRGSAFHDRRFSPLERRELASLQCSVSLLCKYEAGRGWDDWTPGRHGIIIEFPDPSGHALASFSATYLPEVASEMGWDQARAVQSLVRKAGFHGTVTDALLRSIKLTRYQSSKHAVLFTDWQKSRRD